MPSEQNVKACFLINEFPSAESKKNKRVREGNLRAANLKKEKWKLV